MAPFASSLLSAALLGFGFAHAVPADDASSLLQVSAGDVDEAADGAELDIEDPHHKAFAIKVKEDRFQCDKFPDYCRAPFNCQDHRHPTAGKGSGIGTADGHANLQYWCRQYPRYAKPMTACVMGDHVKYAQLKHAEQTEMSQRPLKPDMLHFQSQYCFLGGFCNMTDEVSDSTTLPDMETLCDARFGRKGWTTYNDRAGPVLAHVGSLEMGGLKLSGTHSLKQIDIDEGIALSYAILACGSGSYHCEAMYCKERFCKDPEWSKRHAHLARREQLQEPKAPKKKFAGGRDRRSKEDWDVQMDKIARAVQKMQR